MPRTVGCLRGSVKAERSEFILSLDSPSTGGINHDGGEGALAANAAGVRYAKLLWGRS